MDPAKLFLCILQIICVLFLTITVTTAFSKCISSLCPSYLIPVTNSTFISVRRWKELYENEQIV